jgi:predicted permease
MNAEFQFHIDRQTEHNIRLGMSPAEARRRALIEFGGTQQYREEMREGRGLAMLRESLRDGRLALRMFQRERAFSFSVVATLALAIGATTAVFTLMRRAILEPLPYPDSGRLVSLNTRYGAWGIPFGVLSQPEVTDLAAMRQAFTAVAPWRLSALDLAREGGSQAERVKGLTAGSQFFPVLQVNPVLGRVFQPEEDVPGAAPVVVLTHQLWNRLGSDSTLIGKELWLNSIRHRVLGVLPESFDFAGAEAVLPLKLDQVNPNGRGGHYLRAIGRLAPGVDLEQAKGMLEVLSARLRTDYPNNYPADLQWSLVGRSLRDEVLGDSSNVLQFLVGAVVLVLLIACANVANLLLARLSRKERDVALRTALGAGRGRLVRQLLTESLILALIGTGIGIVLATFGANALLALSPGAIPRVNKLQLDIGVLLTAIGLAGGSVLLFGLVPALRGTRSARRSVALWAGRGTSAEGWGGGSRGFMATLVTIEVALATLVVIWAGLLLKSYDRLARVDLGFTPSSALAFDISLSADTYPDPVRVNTFYDRLRSNLAALPGIQYAGGVRSLPLRSGTGSLDIELEGRPMPPGQTGQPDLQVMTPGYFQAMGIRLIQGRLPDATDTPEGPMTAWVNESAAKRLWPGESPLGKRYHFYGDSATKWFTVVGVVGDVRTVAAATPPVWEHYLLHAQLPRTLPIPDFHRSLSVVVRATTDPSALISLVQATVRDLDPKVAAAQVETMQAVTSRAIARPRLVAMLLTTFGLLAGLLATVGIYGVLSYAVSRRTREIGIRMALGARGAQVVRLMATQGLQAAAIGILLGAAFAVVGSKLVKILLFDVGPRDPLVLGAGALAIGLVALTAAFIPARRAARVHPMETLRAD